MDLYHQVSLVRFVSLTMIFSIIVRVEDRIRSSQASFAGIIELLHVSMDACFRMGCFLVRFETDYGFVVRIHRHTIVTQQRKRGKQLIYIKKKRYDTFTQRPLVTFMRRNVTTTIHAKKSLPLVLVAHR